MLQLVPAIVRKRLFTLGSAVIAIVGALGTFGSGLFEDAADDIADNIVFFLLTLVGLVLISIANIDSLRSALGLQSPVHLGRVYRDWLHAAKYRVQDRTTPEFHFALGVTDQQERPFTIQIPRDRPDRVLFSTGIGLIQDDVGKEAMSKMDPNALTAVAKRLQLEMARYGVGYRGLGPPFENIILATSGLADSSLDEYRFFEKLDYLRNALILLTVLFEGTMNVALQTIPVEPSAAPEEALEDGGADESQAETT